MMAESGHACWNCGSPVEPTGAFGLYFDGGSLPLAYNCYECDVSYSAIVAPNPRFTDLEVMREMGLIDHAIVHLASPA